MTSKRWYDPRSRLTDTRWRTHGQILAQALGYGEFTLLAGAYIAVTDATEQLAQMRDLFEKVCTTRLA